jgi:chromosome segregation ATPase
MQEIETKITQCKEEMEKLNNYLLEIEKSIQKLLSEKDIARSRLNGFSGAIQAYQDSLNVMKGVSSEVVSVDVSGEVISS